jgi:hypothetical protein
MVKIVLAAGAVLVALIWAFCAFLWLSPLEPDGPKTVALPDAASIQAPASTARARIPSSSPAATPAAPAASPVVPAAAGASPDGPGAVAVAPPAPLPDVPPATSQERRDTAVAPVQPQPPPATATTSAPQYTALGGYVFDGDSVVIAPPVSSEGPNSAAEQRRRTRLSTDIGKLP